MPSVTIEKLSGEPILIVTLEGRVTVEELNHVREQSLALTQNMDGPVCRISDTRGLTVNFSDLVLAMQATAQDRPGLIPDPKFVDLVVLTPGSLIQMAVQNVRQEQYGRLELQVFETVDDALAFARGS